MFGLKLGVPAWETERERMRKRDTGEAGLMVGETGK